MLTKVISGGQIGADIAGLRAAKRCGIATGGFIPKDYLTLAGIKPEYADLYDLVETDTDRYPLRTFRNVHDSDATLRIAYNFGSPGERCTLKAINKYNKPRFDMYMRYVTGESTPPYDPIQYLVSWLSNANFNISVLNVAGNARLDMEPIVEDFLVNVFSAVNGLSDLTIA